MTKEEKIKYSYESMVKNNPDEAVKQLIKQEKDIISYRNKIAKSTKSIIKLINYGDEWHWDNAAIRDYAIVIFNILSSEFIKEIPQFEGTLEQLDKLSIGSEDNE